MKQVNLSNYRWVMLIFCCIINLCIGSIYSWSVLSVPMADELGTDNLSGPFSMATSIGVITMIIGGILNDKFGPRWVMFVGGIMFGGGMFLSGFAQSVTSIMLTYGVILGLGATLVYGCTINNTIKFFPDKRGMIGGLTTAFYGISSVVIAPIANVMCSELGIRPTFRVLGIICAVIICLGSFLMKQCPDDFVPAGYRPAKVTDCVSKTDYTPLEMLKKPIFYIMMLLLVCGGFFGMMVISSAQSIAINMVSVTATTASLIVSVLCIFNTAGRLVAGALSDYFGRINTLLIAIILAAIGLIALLTAESTSGIPTFLIGTILIGISFGTFLGVYPGFCADQFGTRYNTVNYGILWVGYSIAGILGPLTLTGVYDSTGQYRAALLISLGIAMAGIVLTLLCRRMLRTASPSAKTENKQKKYRAAI